MKFSDEQIRNILELKEQITEKIAQCKGEIEKLEKNLFTLNAIIVQSSFTKASDLDINTPKTGKEENKITIPKHKKGATPFSIDDNLFHTSTEGKILEKKKNEAPE